MTLRFIALGVILYLNVDKNELPLYGESKRKGGKGTWLGELYMQPESFI